jgi:hypothetical protein
MGIHDAFIHVQVRVFSRHRLIYEFKRGAIHEGFFGKVRIPGSVGQHSSFCRTAFRFLSDSVPG